MNKFGIFGLGAIGSNLMMQLIKLFPKVEYLGFDFDKVEERNLNTQAYFLPQIGMYKALAMQVVIGMKARNINYTPFLKKVKEDEHFIKNCKDKDDVLLIDCFDNFESRKLLENIDNCVHIGFSPQYTAEIIWGKQYTVPQDIPPEQIDICEMKDAVPFINYVVSFACLSIKKYINTRERESFMIFDKYKWRRL